MCELPDGWKSDQIRLYTEACNKQNSAGICPGILGSVPSSSLANNQSCSALFSSLKIPQNWEDQSICLKAALLFRWALEGCRNGPTETLWNLTNTKSFSWEGRVPGSSTCWGLTEEQLCSKDPGVPGRQQDEHKPAVYLDSKQGQQPPRLYEQDTESRLTDGVCCLS